MNLKHKAVLVVHELARTFGWGNAVPGSQSRYPDLGP